MHSTDGWGLAARRRVFPKFRGVVCGTHSIPEFRTVLVPLSFTFASYVIYFAHPEQAFDLVAAVDIIRSY